MLSESKGKRGDRRTVIADPAAAGDDRRIGAADPAAEAGGGRTGFSGRDVLTKTLKTELN